MMAQWGIPFDHIESNWTDRQFVLFAERLTERLDAQNRAAKGKGRSAPVKSVDWMKAQGYLPSGN